MGYIYLILQIDSVGLETHKIGVTKNDPNLRVKQLSTGNSNQIRLLDYYESENNRKIEVNFHKRFKSYKTQSKNEWFNLPNEFILNFKQECKKADDLIIFLKQNNYFYH